MKIVVIGAGHIGLVTALSLAHHSHEVLCVDVDQKKINSLSEARTDIYEPQLAEFLKCKVIQNKIRFSCDYSVAIHFSNIVFVAVGTPSDEHGCCDLSFLESALYQLQQKSVSKKTIIIKSTVPPGTIRKFQSVYPQFDFVSSPEFLREGQALQDALNPERVIAGSYSKSAVELVRSIYLPFLKNESDFIEMDPTSSELTKYAANSFLAARISLINEFSKLCEKLGANIESVAAGLAKDSRIGPLFLKAGIGYGGSCFPKDIDALLNFASLQNEEMKIMRAVKSVNDQQVEAFTQKIIGAFRNSGKKSLAIWGGAFKPDTNDIREAPALKIIDQLLCHDFDLKFYDPFANSNVGLHFQEHSKAAKLQMMTDKMSTIEDSHALIVLTEWSDFIETDLKDVKSKLIDFKIFDGRNIFSEQRHQHIDLDYTGVGL